MRKYLVQPCVNVHISCLMDSFHKEGESTPSEVSKRKDWLPPGVSNQLGPSSPGIQEEKVT